MGDGASFVRHFGSELRHYREAGGYSRDETGAKVGYTGDLIGKVERAVRVPSEKLARGADELFGTDGTFYRLWQRIDAEDTTLTLGFRTYLGLEPTATAIHTYEPHAVPGLLQTEAYARAVIAAERPRLAPGVVETRLAARLTRQEILSQEVPPRVWAILGETALHQCIGSEAVMAEALGHVLEMIALPQITVQVHPFSAGASPAYGVGFLVAEFATGPEIVHVDAPPGVSAATDGETGARFRVIFDHLRAAALPEDASVARIEVRVDELRGT